MKTKDLIIYKGIAAAAARVFENVICPAGEYTAKYLAKEVFTHLFYKEEYYNKNVKENEIITVSFDGSKCTFPVIKAFEICAQIETAFGVPVSQRVKFVRKAETHPVSAAFAVPATAKEIIKLIPSKRDNIYTELNFVCVDTRRRCLVTVSNTTLTAVAVPDMYVSPDAKDIYLLDPDLLKTGKGYIFVDEETAANGTQIKKIYNERPFPNWAQILPAVNDTQKINLTPAFFKQLKKEIVSAGKFSDNANNLVKICGRSGCKEITVNYFRIFEKEGTPETGKSININLPNSCPFDFSVQINGKQFAAVPAADSLYIYRNTHTGKTAVALITAGAVSYLLNLDYDKDVNAAAVPAFEETAAQDLFSLAMFPEIDTPNSAAAVALIETPAVPQDEETAPDAPAAAVSFAFEETPAVPQDEETAPDAPAVPQDEETAPQNEETPAPAANTLPVPCFAEKLHAIYLDGILYRVFYSQLLADEEFYKLFFAGRDVFPYSFPANETAPDLLENVITPADVPQDAAPQPNENAAKIETLLNKQFENYLHAVSLDEETAPQNEETPAPADSVEFVPVSLDEETVAQDEETAPDAPAVLIAANFVRRARRLWQTAAAVLILFICSAVPVSLDEVTVAQDEETPAPADSIVFVPADSVEFAPADSVEFVPADSVEFVSADSVVFVPADSVEFVPVDSVVFAPADSVEFVPADSVEFAPADSVEFVPADSVEFAPADSVVFAPADSVEFVPVSLDEETAPDAPAVPQDEETAPQNEETAPDAPAVPQDEETAPQNEETPAPAANTLPAPAVSFQAPAVPVIVWPYIIDCNIIH